MKKLLDVMPMPEHEKLRALEGKNQVCGEFIEWLGGQGYHIAGRDKNKRSFDLHRTLADFFEIDREKLEAEKIAVLDNLVKMENRKNRERR